MLLGYFLIKLIVIINESNFTVGRLDQFDVRIAFRENRLLRANKICVSINCRNSVSLKEIWTCSWMKLVGSDRRQNKTRRPTPTLNFQINLSYVLEIYVFLNER